MFDSSGQLLYSLYGIVEHSGGMHGGHYTAYVRLRPEMSLARVKDTRTQENEAHCCSTDGNVNPSSVAEGIGDGPHKQFDTKLSMQGQWYYVSDSHVRTATVSEVLKAQGYILFYERLPFL